MIDAFWGQALAPFFVLACLVIGYPITYYVRHKMKDGAFRRLLLNTSWKKRFPLLPLLAFPLLALWGFIVVTLF